MIPFLRDLLESGMLAPLVTLVIGVAGFVVQHVIAIQNDKRMRQRELEKELRDAFMVFYIPLIDVISPLKAYLESGSAKGVDLSLYDPSLSSHRVKLRTVAGYCGYMSAIFRSYRSPLLGCDGRIAKNLGVIRKWMMGILFLQKEDKILEGCMVRDADALEAISELEKDLQEEREKMNELAAKKRK